MNIDLKKKLPFTMGHIQEYKWYVMFAQTAKDPSYIQLLEFSL